MSSKYNLAMIGAASVVQAKLESVLEVAQIGAVIGREFSHELLAAASELPESELERATDQLVAAGLVFRRGGANQATYASSTTSLPAVGPYRGRELPL